MTRTEERLREAFADAAQTVRPETLRSLTAPAQGRRRTVRWVAPLVAAASVGAVVAGTVTLRDHGAGKPQVPVLTQPNTAQVPSPDPATATSAGVRAAERSIVKITATAPGCRRRIQGTGFVYAPQRVMTNAHVVAGSRGPVGVSLSAGHARYWATVVLYDPRRDVAVLAVPGLRAPALTFNPTGVRGAPAVIAGYVHDAPALTATAARIRARQTIQGSDVHRSPQVRREIFSIRGTVQLGVSGGPLLATDGTVYGLVFGEAPDDAQTAYALTVQEIDHDAQTGRAGNRTVSTQACAP
jgi:hypothetical protein